MFDSGSHRSALNGNFIPSGITPTTVVGTSLMRTVRPMIDRSLPYRVFQMPPPRMTTGVAPGWSSSGRKSRPTTVRCPINLNALPEIYGPT